MRKGYFLVAGREKVKKLNHSYMINLLSNFPALSNEYAWISRGLNAPKNSALIQCEK